jgi:tRNA A-37 threonylcarbamoyl transferase component Bud32
VTVKAAQPAQPGPSREGHASDAPPSLLSLDQPAPTAIMPAAGAACPACRKANHPGVTHCVFCGAEYPLSLGETPKPPATLVQAGALTVDGKSRTLPAISGAAAAVTLPAALTVVRTAWSEGPLSGNSEQIDADNSGARVAGERPQSDPAPHSRRAFFDSDSDDMLGPPVADPLIGVVVAERYRIVEPLGRGGMGIVYKVEHSRIGKLLAMKLLTGELSRNPEVVRRFKQEALTASKLSSPNTVQVFDFGASEGLTYLVMELVAGEDLARVLRTLGPMPFSRLGKVVVQVCTSLAEAHQKGIVHRDVKPENVMLLRARDGTDVAKVLDFGLAKLREGADLNDVTSQGAIVGTPYFMAPEQIRGEAVDPRTDIYALGALMYRALTGHYPFNGPTPMAVFTKHLTENAVPPIDRAPELGIPPGVSRIVEKALAKLPGDRFQRVEDLQSALVDEVRASGNSSVEALLDSGQLRKLAKAVSPVDAQAAAAVEIATRDEVERYERKLRRMRWGTLAALSFVAAGVTGLGVKIFYHERDALQRGREIEPNDTPAQATYLPFDSTITGYLGKRLEPTRGDRDFYAVDVPAAGPGQQPVVKLTVSALPNFAMCTIIYRQGFDTALGQYCVGRAGRELRIPALRLDPGHYFVAVLQDLDPYGGAAPFLHENVSDAYTVTFGPAVPAPEQEVEPNDQFASANPISPGVPITGTIGWIHDVDMYCLAQGHDVLASGASPIRWKAKDTGRDVGGVLEVTPMAGPLEGAPVRLHTAAGKVSATDVQSPWQSAAIPSDGETPRCLRVRVTNDPQAGTTVVVPTGGPETYTVEVEAAP